MAAATVDGKTIRQQLVERGWMFPGAATATSTLASAPNYINDTQRLKGTGVPSSLFENAIVRIPRTSVASALSEGDRVRVDYVDVDNGRLYVSPNLSGLNQTVTTRTADATNVILANQEYEVWLKGIDPDIVDRMRDEQLRKTCSMWRVQTLCMIDDGDMDASSVTAWNIGGSATRTKSFSTFPEVHGRRQLNVVHTTASTDYVESNAIDVQPGERFFLEVPVSAYITATSAAATASVVVRDVTNTANVSLGGIRTSHTGRGWGVISLLFSVPTGCYQLKFRLTSDTNASTTRWGPIACHRRSKTRFSLPDRITSKARVGTTFRLSQPVSATSEVDDLRYKLREYANVERKQVGSQVELWFNPPLENNPVFYHERGYYDTLQLATDYYITGQFSSSGVAGTGRIFGDDATTDCPRDYIVAATSAAVAKYMLSREPGNPDWQSEWVRAEQELNYWEGEFGPEPQLIEENEAPVSIAYLRV